MYFYTLIILSLFFNLITSLYGCSLYGTDYFRPQQQSHQHAQQQQQQQQSHQQSQKQQQHLLSVAMAAMTNPTLQGCVYPTTADLNTTFNATYQNFLNSHNSTTIPIQTDALGNCLTGTPENITLNGTIYANHPHQSQQQQTQQQNNLLPSTPIPGSITHIPDALNNSTRPESGLYQWLIPSHLLKTNGNNNSNTNNNTNNDCHMTIPASPAFSLNPANHLIGLDKTNRHVQMLL